MTSTKSKFLISAVPLMRISLLRDQSFFYTSTTKIPFGTVVRMPFGRRYVTGIVLDSHKDFTRTGGMDLKSIGEVIQECALTKKQHRLALFISSYYFCSYGVVLKHFILTPTTPRTKKTKIATPTQILPSLPHQEQKMISEIMTNLSKNKHVLLQTTYNAFAHDILLQIINTFFATNSGQILVLVPERSLIPLYTQMLTTFFAGEVIAIIATTRTKGERSQDWERLRNKKTRIILGTRSAIFAPFCNLDLIIITDAHDDAYKQWEMHPRYDARICAKKLADIYNKTSLLSVSASPRITEIYHAQKRNAFLALPSSNEPQLEIVDMKRSYWKHNEKRHTKQRPLISEELLAHITKNLARHEQTLLFINRQGKNVFSVCTKCKSVFRCTQCERALTERTKGSYRCLHCSYETTTFPSCPLCHNITFKGVGIGTEQIEEFLHKAFPHATIARIDGDSMKKRTSYNKLFHQFSDGTIDILVGTQMATKGWSVPNLTLTAIIDMDALLGGKDYNSDERAYAHILQLGSCVGMHGRLVVQVFDTLHSIIQSAQHDNWKEFMEEELDMRRLLHFPPHTRIIKLLYQAKDPHGGEIVTYDLYERLSALSIPNISISAPHDPLLHKIRTQYRKQIIIKVPYKKMPQELDAIFVTLDAQWIIDIDPVHIA